MGQEIQQLDPTTVERIAAGEVVERPASVVKELLENSLDADANRVRVSVEAGGKDGIAVSDDGIGMDETAARRAVEKHTTSKIRDIDDLESGVATLGFRGEALHAIGAVSRLTISTRPRGGTRGTEVVVEGGDVESVGPAGCPEGTTIEIDDLFYNVPARRKYLKTDATEFAHVNTVVTAYALANPDVAVELEHDGRETFATTGRGRLKETVMAVYGREVAESMIAVDARVPDADVDADPQSGTEVTDLPEGPLRRVAGLVSHPETNRSGRDYLSTYVNGRYVTANAVRDAVVDAYGGQLAADRYPFAVLFVELAADQVDVNVHPRKMEVRFAESDAVADQVSTAVEDALVREGLIRSGAPRGRSAHDETDVSPGDAPPDADERGTSDASEDRAERSDTAETGGDSGSTPSDTPGDTGGSASDGTTAGAASRGAGPGAASDGAPERSASSGTRTPAASDGTRGDSASDTGTGGSTPDRPSASDQRDPAASTPSDAVGDSNDNSREGNSGGSTVDATEQRRFGESDPTDRSFETLPSLRVLGQFRDSYVVAEGPDGLVLIDQHAADERINYERLRERFLGDTPTQALADPVRIELTAREAELFETVTDALARLGFQADRVGDGAVEVRTVPALLADAGGPELVRDVLTSFAEGEDAAAATVEAAVDELLADLACYPSVTANTELTDGSIVSLLDALDDCENPYACPHGRPVVIEFDDEEIEDRFERDYPGH
jgi:DNA mismatch repair protein MutL